MSQYVVFREDFQRDTWVFVGQSVADDPEQAVRRWFSAAPGNDVAFGTYAAIPHEEFTEFVTSRTLQRIFPRIETVEPVAVPE